MRCFRAEPNDGTKRVGRRLASIFSGGSGPLGASLRARPTALRSAVLFRYRERAGTVGRSARRHLEGLGRRRPYRGLPQPSGSGKEAGVLEQTGSRAGLGGENGRPGLPTGRGLGPRGARAAPFRRGGQRALPRDPAHGPRAPYEGHADLDASFAGQVGAGARRLVERGRGGPHGAGAWISSA